MENKMSHKLLCSLIIVLIIAACAPSSLDKKVDVGGYGLRILCSGKGTPTVIIESEFGDPSTESTSWTNVISGVEKTTRICVYDRAGLGSSDRPQAKSRTSQDIVKDLHTLLDTANVPGPYVLVGHGFGGFQVRLYTSQYPDEVVGMVLVGAYHPDEWSEVLAVLPPESPDEPERLKEIRTMIVDQFDDTSNPERVSLSASVDLIRATNGFGDLPLVVITRNPDLRIPDLPLDVAAKIEQVHQSLQIELLSLSSNSFHVVVPRKSNPFIPIDEPQLVIDAILKVVNEAKK
jgi:pimeloyl-ACP methyl ester carboxylesterase